MSVHQLYHITLLLIIPNMVKAELLSSDITTHAHTLAISVYMCVGVWNIIDIVHNLIKYVFCFRLQPNSKFLHGLTDSRLPLCAFPVLAKNGKNN